MKQLLLILMLTCGGVIGSDLSKRNLSLCTKSPTLTPTKVFFGWPVGFDCSDLFLSLNGNVGDKGDCVVYDAISEGIVRNTSTEWENLYGMGLLTAKFTTLGDANDSAPTNYTVIAQNYASGKCQMIEVQFNFVPFKQQTCVESYEEGSHKAPMFQVSHGYSPHVLCDLYETKLAFPNQKDIPGLQVKFLKNCSDLPTNDKNNYELLPYNQEMELWKRKLTINKVSYENAGYYSCEVNYKGQKFYLVHHDLCVKRTSPSDVTATISCDKKNPVEVGEDVEVSCNAYTKVTKIFNTVDWYKQLDKETKQKRCQNLVVEQNATIDKSLDYDCTIEKLPHDELKCLLFDPGNDTTGYDLAPHKLTFFIRNVQPDDYGVYRVELRYADNIAYATVEIVQSHITADKNKSVIIGVVIGILMFFIVLAALVYWKRIYFLWFYKKKFGPCETEIRTYDVFMMYYFITDVNKMDESAQEKTKSIVLALREAFLKFNMKIFDDHMEISPSKYKAENCAMHKECHRVVIVLTPEYITDYWSLHTAYQALQNMIENETKIVIIKTPGVGKALKDVNRPSSVVIKRALKMYHAITWNGSLPFSTEKLKHLEYAMPKLSKDGRNVQESKTVIFSSKEV